MDASTPLFLNRELRHEEAYYCDSLMQTFPAQIDSPPYLKEM